MGVEFSEDVMRLGYVWLLACFGYWWLRAAMVSFLWRIVCLGLFFVPAMSRVRFSKFSSMLEALPLSFLLLSVGHHQNRLQ